MLDDASFYTFVPSAQSQEANLHLPKHRRKTSVLEQTPVSRPFDQFLTVSDDAMQAALGANSLLLGAQNTAPQALEDKGPPRATLVRRAQSYTDFHHAARAVFKANAKEEGDKSTKGIRNELEFADWYDSLENELSEASHDQFKSDSPTG